MAKLRRTPPISIMISLAFFSFVGIFPQSVDFDHRETITFDNTLVRGNFSSTVNEISDVLGPLQIFRDYQQRHSTEALKGDLSRRKYAIVFYRCPDRAGNFLHNMYISMTWSILTNRTMLLAYAPSTVENTANSEGKCHEILKMAPWIPRYIDYQHDIPTPVPIPIDVRRRLFDEIHTVVIFPQIPDIPIPNLYRLGWSDHPLGKKHGLRYVQDMPDLYQRRAAQLYQNGINFIYGMLFHETMTVQLEKSVESTETQGISFALHSRHIGKADDGSYVNDEIRCLTKLLPYNRTRDNCHVFLMSDRENTLALLSQWLVKENCTPIVSAHETGTPWIAEHGPFAGAGFFQDLIHASQARNGVIGDVHRSSYMLLKEAIIYNRLRNGYHDELKECVLPERSTSGYNYGPGTPTFIRDAKKIPPLEPVRIVKEYAMQHSIDTMQEDGQLFAKAFLPCGLIQRNDFMGLNQFLWAILNNRTLLWNAQKCPADLELASWAPRQLNGEETIGNITPPMIKLKLTTSEKASNAFGMSLDPTISALFSLGPEFLYGLLLDTLYDIPKIQTLSTEIPNTSILLISRTSTPPNYKDEIECLQTLRSRLSQPCNIHLGSLDQYTQSTLHGWISMNTNCTTTSTNNTVDPFRMFHHSSGSQLVLIGNQSDFLLAKIQFDFAMESWRLGRVPPIIPTIDKCLVQDKPVNKL